MAGGSEQQLPVRSGLVSPVKTNGAVGSAARPGRCLSEMPSQCRHPLGLVASRRFLRLFSGQIGVHGLSTLAGGHPAPPHPPESSLSSPQGLELRPAGDTGPLPPFLRATKTALLSSSPPAAPRSITGSFHLSRPAAGPTPQRAASPLAAEQPGGAGWAGQAWVGWRWPRPCPEPPTLPALAVPRGSRLLCSGSVRVGL